MGEDRPRTELEFAGFLVEDRHAGDVRRQQIRGALDALHIHRDRTGQGPRQHGLAGAGHIFQQHMAAAQQRHHGQFDHRALADDDALDVFDQSLNLLHGSSVFRLPRRGHGEGQALQPGSQNRRQD